MKAKILVVGPRESGKTWLCNYLAGATESSGGEYHPTQGVRILEFEVEGEDPGTGKALRVEVELWDCSGSKQFEKCWPAIRKDSHGVVLVHNPDQPRQEKELERWYSQFVSQQGLGDDQCVIFSHHKPTNTDNMADSEHLQISTNTDNMADSEHLQISSERLSQVHQVHSDLEEDPETVREEFHGFLLALIASWRDRQRLEEGSLISGEP